MPDPRIANEGDSFADIVKLITGLVEYSNTSEDCSWLDGFARIKAEPQMNSVAFESTVYQYALAREKICINKEQAEAYEDKGNHSCLCPCEMKNNCKVRGGFCLCRKKMKAYLIAGEKLPTSIQKNKYIICKIQRPYPYKIVKGNECVLDV